ncbi:MULTISPECIES: helix-turn-helix domain-containing protein [Legionella]|uniref:DNA-binding transcriptional regulator n=1 Tax=Legionella maceachernii TaxID=466 RepID=A0A0W0WH03_9GAMM|nr:XRE family transcriptional regulator [Legionella maceachernii]KTD31566.1 DNA-binding transcriptional regulator [Legionella maceachernii]SKA11508.1 transcriptional regulator, XRE family with cupin sensor [Legionella maceachernii]SUO99610.1 DNA-binding transcriptional repressor PuuR [Legionella maceachernii]
MKNISRHIAETLKQLRQQRGLSLDKTAQLTGVSKAMLGQIEREESSPTIATLWKIASGFQTSFSSFIETFPTESEGVIYRSVQTQRLSHVDDQIRITTLFPFDQQLHFELFSIELPPGCEHLSTAHEPGVIEHVIVVSGQMEILLNNTWQSLEQGDALRFAASQAHGYRNQHSSRAVFHNIIHYP